MLASDVIDVVRENLDDIKEEYRFDDPELLNTLTSSTRRLAVDRPDLLVDDDGLIIPIVDVTTLSQVLVFDRDFLEALSNHVCFLIFAKDNSDNHNATQSAIHKSLYDAAIN